MKVIYDALHAHLNTTTSKRPKISYLLHYKQCPVFENDYDLIRKQKGKELVFVGLFEQLTSLIDCLANVRVYLQDVVKKWASYHAIGSVKVEKLMQVKVSNFLSC